jgi:predicted SAM-dependent methyltransferase
MKINLGCGTDILEGYINYDLQNPQADILGDATSLPFQDNSMDEIFSSHLLEHFDYFEAHRALIEWRRVLRPEGLLILELPNLLELCRSFVSNPTYNGGPIIGIYGFPWLNGHTHKMGYSPDQLTWTLKCQGFKDIVMMPTTRYIGWGNLCMRFEAKKDA